MHNNHLYFYILHIYYDCVQIVFGIWKSVILFHTVGECRGSAWIAVWNVLFAFVAIFVVIICSTVFINFLILKLESNYR